MAAGSTRKTKTCQAPRNSFGFDDQTPFHHYVHYSNALFRIDRITYLKIATDSGHSSLTLCVMVLVTVILYQISSESNCRILLM